MKIRTIVKLAGEGMANLRARSGMGLTAVTIITLAFFVLGLFLLAFFNLISLDQTISQRLQLRVFLIDGVNPAEVADRLRGFREVRGLAFVSKAEALESLRQQLGERSDLLDLATDNPLPDTFIVTVADPRDLPRLAERAGLITGVEEVVYGQDSLGKILDVIAAISILSLLGMGIIFLATLFIVVNTIRLTVISRRREIEIRKLVGATKNFIRAPFLFEGVFMGVFSACIACLAGSALYRFAVQKALLAVPFLPLLSTDKVIPDMVSSLLILGLIMGVIGSSLSVRKYLV